jgi:hypothetical protein
MASQWVQPMNKGSYFLRSFGIGNSETVWPEAQKNQHTQSLVDLVKPDQTALNDSRLTQACNFYS